MVLWVFDGNMVGKWTNEPCNGVDEVVNPFWVLTLYSVLFEHVKLLMALFSLFLSLQQQTWTFNT